MYTLIFYLVDINDNVLYAVHTLQDIATLLGDMNICNCRGEQELAMYLMENYYHHTINGTEFYFSQQNIDNDAMTFTIRYKQL